MEEALNARREALAQAALEKKLAEEAIDVTLPGRTSPAGGIHPVIRTFALYFGNGISNHLLVLLYTIVAILAAMAYRRFLTAIHWK